MPRKRPLGLSPLFERSADEGKQGDVACLLDGGSYNTLVACACTRLSAGADLAVFGDVLPKHISFLVVNRQGFICTELTEFGLRKKAAVAASFWSPLRSSITIIRHLLLQSCERPGRSQLGISISVQLPSRGTGIQLTRTKTRQVW